MDPCGCCAERRGFCFLVKRALRASAGIILIGVLTSYVLRDHFKSEVSSCSCPEVEMELDRLRKDCQTKEELLLNDVRASNSDGCSDSQTLEKNVRALVREKLDIYGSDKTGLFDFALESLGACIVTTRDTVTFKGGTKTFFGLTFSGHHSQPEQILRPDMTPGSCWAFIGGSGTIVVKLMSHILVSHVTIEHVSPLMTPSGDISSAPRTFSLIGWHNLDSPKESHHFGNFEYKKEGPLVQTFAVRNPAKRPFQIVEVTFRDNHGNSMYTCVYRVRIHGKQEDHKKSEQYETDNKIV